MYIMTFDNKLPLLFQISIQLDVYGCSILSVFIIFKIFILTIEIFILYHFALPRFLVFGFLSFETLLTVLLMPLMVKY